MTGNSSDNMRGALLMMAGMAAFTVNDTVMKHLGDTLALFPSLALRGAFVVLGLGFLAWRAGALTWRQQSPRDRRLILIRTGCDTVSTWFFLQALYAMPLANMVALFQALPLTITLGAALFLGESVGWRRGAAIALGFVGVLLIVRPDAQGFDGASVYALTAVLLVTVRDLITRRLSRGVPSLLVAFLNAAAVMVFGLIGVMGMGGAAVPDAPLLPVVGWAALAAGFILIGYLTTVMAVRVGEMAAVTPFRYTALVWGLLLGFVVFGEWPDALTMLGAALIMATGLFTLYRERATARRSKPPAPMFR